MRYLMGFRNDLDRDEVELTDTNLVQKLFNTRNMGANFEFEKYPNVLNQLQILFWHMLIELQLHVWHAYITQHEVFSIPR